MLDNEFGFDSRFCCKKICMCFSHNICPLPPFSYLKINQVWNFHDNFLLSYWFFIILRSRLLFCVCSKRWINFLFALVSFQHRLLNDYVSLYRNPWKEGVLMYKSVNTVCYVRNMSIKFKFKYVYKTSLFTMLYNSIIKNTSILRLQLNPYLSLKF